MKLRRVESLAFAVQRVVEGSRRTIDLPQWAVEALVSHRKRQLDEHSFVGEGWEKEDDITLLTLQRSAARS